jgi:OHCU decarboxylase
MNSEPYQHLRSFNSLSAEDASSELEKCCGSKRWARELAARRPFSTFAELCTTAEAIWWSLQPADWLEAFRGHPKIGERTAVQHSSTQARQWSQQEQAGVNRNNQETIELLAKLNREYEEKFGYIFIVCATGKSSAEMLAILRERLDNDAATELPVAADEQAKITQLRLGKLLDR